MAIQLSPETERLVEQQIASGRFHSIDEIIEQGIRAKGEEDEEHSHKRREAIERTRQFIEDPIRLTDVSFQEIMQEGRKF